MEQTPYIEKTVVTVQRLYNPDYGDDRLCQCGHRYYRHFDTYEDMAPVGCKYCDCVGFVEFVGDIQEVVKWVESNSPGEFKDLNRVMEEACFSVTWLYEKCLELKYRFEKDMEFKILDCERDSWAVVDADVAVEVEAPVCEHQPGKFLGHSMSPNYERHECAKCGDEFSMRINR